ncbi:MAG: hypothetical protein ACRC1T_08985 [Clostridium chrysemydis]|uniref:hypothetical protein n=1 Tax=Clostridium chrysemydis TaxID=2665504 RepID=UPI003F3AE534
MTSKELKMLLANNSSIVADVVSALGAHHITIVEGKRIQFGMSENKSGRAHCVFLDHFLTHKDYPNGITEDFIAMVARLKNIDYVMAVNFICLFVTGDIKPTNGDDAYVNTYNDRPLDEYDESILETYPKVISELFMNDGIPPSVQSAFGVRFSDTYNRILIPIHQKGKLVGLFGRWNEKNVDNEFIPKYFPILPYQKGKVLYPYDINSEYVKKYKWCYLVESEKTPMLTYKWGIRNIFALGGNAVKSHQIELLKELGVEKIILALDKGLGDGFVEFSALRLKEYGFDVYYIDVENIPYLPDKDSVFDLNNKDLVLDTIKKYTRRA